MRKLHQRQGKHPSSYAFYTEDGKDEKSRSYRTTMTLKDEPKDENDQESSSTAIEVNESLPQQREFMIRSNNLEYFYEEKETSENVYRYHQRLNSLWRVTSWFALVFACWAFYKAYEQQQEIWDAAGKVVIPKTREVGARTRRTQDGSIEVIVDGKLIDLISPSSLHPSASSASDYQLNIRQAIAYIFEARSRSKKLQDFFYYNQAIKPELREFSP